MRFLVDAQLPPALARWLAAEGHEAVHVADRQMETASDSAIWEFALRISAVIVTKDEDFAQRKALTGNGPGVVWSRLPTPGDSSCWRGCNRSFPIFSWRWRAARRRSR